MGTWNGIPNVIQSPPSSPTTPSSGTTTTNWWQKFNNFLGDASGFISLVNPIAGGISSLFGSIFGGDSQEDSNEKYYQIMRETNAQNYQIWQEQMQHNLDMYNLQKQDTWDMAKYQNSVARTNYEMQRRDQWQDTLRMWNMQNEYNSPEAQAKRWQDAGFNPLNVLGSSGNTGSAMSAPSASLGSPASMSPPSMMSSSPPTMQAPGQVPTAVTGARQMSETISGIVDSVNKSIEALERVKGLKTDNKNKQAVYNAQLSNLGEQFEQLSLANQLQTMTMAYQYGIVKEQFLGMQAENTLKRLNIQTQTMMNEVLPVQLQQQLARGAVELVNLVKDGQIKDRQAQSILVDIIYKNAQTAHVNAQTEGQKQNNRIIAVEADKAENMAMTKDEAKALADELYKSAKASAIADMRESIRRGNKAHQFNRRPDFTEGVNALDFILDSLSPFKLK